MENYQAWLNENPPITEEKDGALFIPIWAVEGDLLSLCGHNWSRYDHKYSFYNDHNGDLWLATSIITEVNYEEIKRTLACSSFIRQLDYPDGKNFLQTGISEATKAGVKVLGPRFGYSLNDRSVPKKKTKERVKAAPDNQIMKAYRKAVYDQDEKTIKRLTTIYDIKHDGLPPEPQFSEMVVPDYPITDLP